MSTEQEPNRTGQELPETDSVGLDRESVNGTAAVPSPDEQIIELVDVVKRGDRAPDQGGGGDTFESLDFDFETLEELDESPPPPETPPSHEPKEAAAGLEETDMNGETGPEPPIREEMPVSADRLEAMIAQTVREVLERVVRQTMAEVAEKVIKEAIEELKKSLEPPPE